MCLNLSLIWKKVYSNFQKKLKLTKTHLFLSQDSFDKSLNLNDVIDTNFVSENINDLISTYGLNPYSFASFSNKLWNINLFIFFWIGLMKYIILLGIDPVANYKLCIFFGDTTLLFQSLRKYILALVILVHSNAICTNYLFNIDINKSWFELFKCLDGTIAPYSIGINDKKILKKMLILTKIVFKFNKFNTLAFSAITMSIFLYSTLMKINFDNNFELIIFLMWMIPITFWVYYLSGTILISNICFQMICYYCFITIKSYNELMDKLIINEFSGSGSRRFIKLKIMNLIKRQNKFCYRIMKYNKFWGKFFFIMMSHLIPTHLIILQQLLFGNVTFGFKVILMISCLIGAIMILLSSLLSSFLVKEIRNFSKKLIRIQFNKYLNLDIKTKLKVR